MWTPFWKLARICRSRFAARELGLAGERRAAWFLRIRGYRVVARNVRLPEGELDLVVRRGTDLVFVEVKTRQQARTGRPAEAVDRRKQLRIARMAERFCRQRGLAAERIRFDVIGIVWTGWRFRIEHFPDAFHVETVPGTPWKWC